MRKLSTKFSPNYTGHSKGVVGCEMSYFNHVVSADSEMVYVWEVETGQRVFGYNAHTHRGVVCAWVYNAHTHRGVVCASWCDGCTTRPANRPSK
eukprot:gene32330-biopygen9629